MRNELVRKAMHASLAFLFAVAAPYVDCTVLIVSALILFVIFLFIRIARVCAIIGSVPRVTYGELFFVLGVVSAALLACPNVVLFQVAMVLLATADPAASIIGIRFGKRQYTVLDEKRSLEGSLACFLTALLVLIAFGTPFLPALVFAAMLTFVEALSLRGSDNLFLPVAAILLLRYIL